jgi:hypothetical protein
MRASTMRRALALILGAGIAIAACGGNDDGDVATRVVVPTRDDALLYLGTQTSITAVAPRSGAIRFAARGAVPDRTWSKLFTTEVRDGVTVLRTLEAETGRTVATRELEGALEVRVVSDDGAVVALAPIQGGVADTYRATPKSVTHLVIVRDGVDQPQRIDVDGNIEPEAFSLSGRTLFVIEFTPPEAPDRYRVAALDLATGALGDVRSAEEELQEPMGGTARARTLAPDGRRLYTLYTRDATPAEPAESFVHVLDLDAERATCVDLPAEFASSLEGALAVAPSGTRLYVIAPGAPGAPGAPAIAEIDTATLTIARAAPLPRVVLTDGPTVRATVADADTLHLAVGATVVTVDLRTLEAGTPWDAPAVVTGLQPSHDPSVLYVSTADGVAAVDPATGAVRRRFAVAAEGPIDHVAPALRPIVVDDGVPCAC